MIEDVYLSQTHIQGHFLKLKYLQFGVTSSIILPDSLINIMLPTSISLFLEASMKKHIQNLASEGSKEKKKASKAIFI